MPVWVLAVDFRIKNAYNMIKILWIVMAEVKNGKKDDYGKSAEKHEYEDEMVEL